jgi:hypothetical protein
MDSRLETAKLLAKSRMLIADANHIGAGFCLADIDMAHTLLDRADVSDNPVVRNRNLRNARRAHQAIRDLRPRLDLNEADAQAVDEGLRGLEKRLANYA